MALKLSTLNTGSVQNGPGTGTKLIGPNASRKRITLLTTSVQVVIGQEQSDINGPPPPPAAPATSPYHNLAANTPNVFEYQGEIWINTLDNSHPIISFAEECD